jgi:uncharacterized protein YjbI with pentapeptide repeats
VPDRRQPYSASTGQRERLQADCEQCFALCCVVPSFSISADFAIDKSAGQPCPNLQPDFRCSIHDQLRPRGFPGCVSYDCFGAGQQVAQVTFGGRDWRQASDTAAQMFGVFPIMRQLHELLWYLNEALTLPAAASLRDELSAALEQTERLTRSDPDALLKLDVGALRNDVNALLLRASQLARAGARSPAAASPAAGTPAAGTPGAGTSEAGTSGSPGWSPARPGAGRRGVPRSGASLAGADLRGADLTGKDLSRADLTGASLRGATLLGVDLGGADLRMADLTGADLRGANLRGADLSASIFVTQSQLETARGDAATKLPAALTRPTHWPPAPAG